MANANMSRTKFVNLKNAKMFKSRTAFVEESLGDKRVKLLDVGNLGEGKINVDIKSLVEKNGGIYYGLDCNENLAEHLGINNQIIGDLHNLKNEVADETFDYIYAGEIIEHTWRPGEMISECNRILKPVGHLILDTPNVYNLINILRLAFKRQDTMGMDNNILTYSETKDNFYKLRNEDKELSTQPQHKIFYSPAMLRQLLNMHGFAIDRYAFIGKPISLMHKWILNIFPQFSNKIGLVARKEKLEKIFDIK